MSDIVKIEAPSTDSETPPAQINVAVKFPPFPEPSDTDFDDDVSIEERNFYKSKYPDISAITSERLHCTSCDRHLGCAPRNESRMRSHPMLRTLVCNTCHTFYNSGEFEKGDDGSELYCRWCGQGGQVYCCSDCPHVFCAKCIKRNFGMPKIKEIENTDDWKCFKCQPECLWSIRALCWAVLRYCDLRNKFTFEAKDPSLKEAYHKACAVDESECCRHKISRKKKDTEKDSKKKESPTDSAKKTANAISKIPPSIQVKKFASMNIEDTPNQKKPVKRSASPKPYVISPMSVTHRMINPISVALPKKSRMTNMQMMPSNTIRIQPRNVNTYTRLRPKAPSIQMAILNNFNGFNTPMQANSFNTAMPNNNFNNTGNYMNNMVVNDNINLSLENLTQGLDMASVSGIANNRDDDDVVCTPDFPLEPLCEVTEENNDDDVQCITPAAAHTGPAAQTSASPLVINPPPLVPRFTPSINDLTSENIIQMTENDVTVNAATGGLKFRVDPQTLSSNKMYRLPDGRIFAINANPNMPGGFSATIVAVTESSNTAKTATKGSMYAAKLSAVKSVPTKSQSPTPIKQTRSHRPRILNNALQKQDKRSKTNKETDSSSGRFVDLQIPVEWYRYNLLDAVDSLQYSLARLQKLKKEATSIYLRTRTIEEMKTLHKTLDRLLSTSTTRFTEIRNNLNRELKQYLSKKATQSGNVSDDDEDDDDVEILNDHNDDPIFIDENSVESTSANETNDNATHEVDLTGGASSEHNNSRENTTEEVNKEPPKKEIEQPADANESIFSNIGSNDNSTNNITKASETDDSMSQDIRSEKVSDTCVQLAREQIDELKMELKEASDKLVETVGENSKADKEEDNLTEKGMANDKTSEMQEQDDIQEKLDSLQDSEMTEELIETLLKDNVGEDDLQTLQNIEISEEFQESRNRAYFGNRRESRQ